MAQFTSDGLALAYDEFGRSDARKAIVLVHGFSSNRYENWKRMGWYDAVAGKGLRGLALDCRGHGESAKPHDAAQYDRAAMARDVFALMDHAGVERAHLLGFSMGAHVALTAAMADDGRIDHLVVAGVGGRIFEPPRDPDGMAKAMAAASPDEIADPMLKSFRHFADEQKEDRLALAACSRGPRAPITREALMAIRRPTLVIAGARDQLAGPPQGLADAIAGAKAVTIPGCDHFSMIAHGLFKASTFDFFDGWLE
ncbi:MAG: alpha/beta hydrolase [Alphaproteobacteria bacterium]|nr:alpha/beta hydrolase [Alphaproteobacteria bacterium]